MKEWQWEEEKWCWEAHLTDARAPAVRFEILGIDQSLGESRPVFIGWLDLGLRLLSRHSYRWVVYREGFV